MSNFHGHTYPDTNENEVRRSFKRLIEKFRLKNTPLTQTDRLEYLYDEFMKRSLKFADKKVKKVTSYAGISDTHHSVVRLLMLLQQAPDQTESNPF